MNQQNPQQQRLVQWIRIQFTNDEFFRPAYTAQRIWSEFSASADDSCIRPNDADILSDFQATVLWFKHNNDSVWVDECLWNASIQTDDDNGPTSAFCNADDLFRESVSGHQRKDVRCCCYGQWQWWWYGSAGTNGMFGSFATTSAIPQMPSTSSGSGSEDSTSRFVKPATDFGAFANQTMSSPFAAKRVAEYHCEEVFGE